MSDLPPQDFWYRRWRVWLAWTALASFVFALLEWEHYSRFFGWQKMGFTGLRKWLLVWTLSAKTMVLFVPWLALGALVVRRRSRAGSVALMLLATLLLAWLVFDLRTVAVTGNHLSTYFAQADVSSLEFAGGAGWMLRYLAIHLTLLGVAVFASAALVSALVRCRYWWSHPGAAVGVYGAVIIGLVPVWMTMRQPDVLIRLHGEWPVSFAWLGFPRKETTTFVSFSYPFDQRANARLAKTDARLQTAAPADEREVLPRETRPDIVFVLIESWRADALNPTWMPALDAWSRRGLRFSNHYAGGNCSPTGLFELLYGRSCLAYSITLNARILPQSGVTFRRSGYRTTYLSTLDDTKRLRGGEFLNRRAFDRVDVSPHANWNDGDRWVISEAQRTLREAHGQPQFLVLFLGSTHHPYPSPPDAQKFQPVMRDGWTILDPDLAQHQAEMRNSYANSAAFMDAQVGAFLASLDLTRTIVAVTGDHGEALFTDGTAVHSSRFSPVQTQVPMFLLGPGIPSGTVADLSINSDILPTVLRAAAQKPVALSGVSGIDLLDESARRQRRSLVLAGFQFDEPFAAALVRPEGRLALDVWISTMKIQSTGLLNERGENDPQMQATAGRPEDWAEAFLDQIDRLAPAQRSRLSQ